MTDVRPRRFALHRLEDASGVSGNGIVAEGVEWSDGTACLRWRTEHRSTAVYNSMLELKAIHGHGGKTRVHWIDGEPLPDEPLGLRQAVHDPAPTLAEIMKAAVPSGAEALENATRNTAALREWAEAAREESVAEPSITAAAVPDLRDRIAEIVSHPLTGETGGPT